MAAKWERFMQDGDRYYLQYLSLIHIFFGCFCGFLYLFLRFFQITVTFVFGIFQQYVISFLIMLDVYKRQ